MPDVITTAYKFTLPEVGASDDTWGNKLNDNLQKLENLFAGSFDSPPVDLSHLGALKSDRIPATINGAKTFTNAPTVSNTGETTFTIRRQSGSAGPSTILIADEAGTSRTRLGWHTTNVFAITAGGSVGTAGNRLFTIDLASGAVTIANNLIAAAVRAAGTDPNAQVVAERTNNTINAGITFVHTGGTAYFGLATGQTFGFGIVNNLATSRTASVEADTGKIHAATFNATSATEGGFQGIGSDSVSQPSFTWTGDLDTGFFRVAADAIGVGTGGVLRFQIANAFVRSYQPHRFTSGSAAAPGIAFQDSQASGFFRQGADAIGVSTGGTERFRFSALGNLVALTTASFLGGSGGSVAAPSFAWNNDQDTGLFSISDNILGIATGGTEAVRVDAGGNLTAQGLFRSESGLSSLSTLSIRANGTAGSPALLLASSTTGLFTVSGDNLIRVSIGGSSAFRFEAGGTGVPVATSGITREKGDARYAAISSTSRLKDSVSPPRGSARSLLSNLKVQSWVWGGQLPEDDPRRGKPAYGLIAEEVDQVFPEAVIRHPQTNEILGLDPLTLIAALIDEVNSLRSLPGNKP